MIRQAISCDICGAEKKQTNHWFVAWEQAGELRVSGWSSRNRMRTGARHLCGQACLHKLADDFMARVIAQKSGSRAAGEEPETQAAARERSRLDPSIPGPSRLGPKIDASLTSLSASSDLESSARLLPATPAADLMCVLPEEPLRVVARNRHAEAWARERERTQAGAEQRPEVVARRTGK